MNSWIKYLVWIVGMLVLLVVSFHFEHGAGITAQQTYRLDALTWTNTIISFVLGVYLSLLFINKFEFSVNKQLLVLVFIPFTIIGFYIPVAISLSLHFPSWLSNINTHGFPTMLSGLSLMVSLFNRNRNNP